MASKSMPEDAGYYQWGRPIEKVEIDMPTSQTGVPGPVNEDIITQEKVRILCWAQDDYNPWYLEDSPWGGPIAQPTFPVMYQNLMPGLNMPAGGGLHTKEQFEFYAPLKVGSKVKITSKFADRYEKRGRTYFVQEYLLCDEDGNKICLCRRHNTPSMFQNPEDRKK
ncbi:MaoC family dehydratase N-terminal domain-containing protein [Chloroflexota bacterium]